MDQFTQRTLRGSANSWEIFASSLKVRMWVRLREVENGRAEHLLTGQHL